MELKTKPPQLNGTIIRAKLIGHSAKAWQVYCHGDVALYRPMIHSNCLGYLVRVFANFFSQSCILP